MRARFLSAVAIVVLTTGIARGGELAQLGQDLQARAGVIKPAPEELKWQRIPWVTDLAEGQRLAQQERRPIFLWVTGDEPLERC